jgi:hypothetical protein
MKITNMKVPTVIVVSFALWWGFYGPQATQETFGLSPEEPKIRKLDANTWSPMFVILDNRVRTFPESVAVEFMDTETGKITVMAPYSDIHLAGVNTVRIRAPEKIRYIVERK